MNVHKRKQYKDNPDTVKKKEDTLSGNTIRNKLFEAISNGDEAAFAEYYTGFVDSLVRFLTKIVGNVEEAKEIAQDVFVKLWESRGKVDPDKQLDGFVYTTAKNMALNVIRKRQVHFKYHKERMSSAENADLSADEEIISRETEILIRHVINNMPPQRRKAFEMSRYEGLSYEEIAREMGLSVDTVKTHIRLALKDIREAVATFIWLVLFY